ncbi:MAG: hypothetical protein OHK0039_25000 [Bacteroidia bacterium]
MTTQIVYYDKEFRDECLEFCRVRNIEYLPDINDTVHLHYYDTQANRFEQRKIQEKQVLHPEAYIFGAGIEHVFLRYPVIFIIDRDLLQGVVHFSDYNHPLVYKALYEKLYRLERGMIHLLLNYGRFVETDFAEVLKEEGGKLGDKLIDRSFFVRHKVSLTKIMLFARNRKLLKINSLEKISLLRNKIAYSEDLVLRTSYATGLLEYDPASFTALMQGCEEIDKLMRQVINRIFLMGIHASEQFTDAVPDWNEIL